MNKLTKISRLMLALVFAATFSSMGFAEENAQVKGLLQEALKLYSEQQYVRALDLFKQAQAIDPQNATADEYIKSTKQRILEWESQGGDSTKDKDKEGSATWDSLLQPKGGNPAETSTNAKDIIAARRSLVERMRNRSVNTDNIVQIQDTAKELDIVLFHDHLFLPGLQTLRDEALPILENVAQMIRTGGDRQVTVVSAAANGDSEESFVLVPDFALPAADPDVSSKGGNNPQAQLQDLEATRALILFTYLAQKGFNSTANTTNE